MCRLIVELFIRRHRIGDEEVGIHIIDSMYALSRPLASKRQKDFKILKEHFSKRRKDICSAKYCLFNAPLLHNINISIMQRREEVNPSDMEGRERRPSALLRELY